MQNKFLIQKTILMCFLGEGYITLIEHAYHFAGNQ